MLLNSFFVFIMYFSIQWNSFQKHDFPASGEYPHIYKVFLFIENWHEIYYHNPDHYESCGAPINR